MRRPGRRRRAATWLGAGLVVVVLASSGWARAEGSAPAGYLVLDIGNDASHDSWPHAGVALTGGLEATRYFSPRVGLSFRLLLGPSLLWRHELVRDGMFQHPTGPSASSWAFDVGLDVGVVF